MAQQLHSRDSATSPSAEPLCSMDELIKTHIPKSAPGDHPWNTSGLIITGIFIIVFLVLGVISAKYWLIKILCLVLIPVPIVIGLRLIREINFGSDIVIKPIYGKPKIIKYSQLRKFYQHYLGKQAMFVWVIEYQQDSKMKKITFYDDDLNFNEFKAVLNKLKNEHNIN